MPRYLFNKIKYEQTRVLRYIKYIWLEFSKHHTGKSLPTPVFNSSSTSAKFSVLRPFPHSWVPPLPPVNWVHVISLPLGDDVLRDEIMVRRMLFSSSGRCMELGEESGVFLGSSHFLRSPVSLSGCRGSFFSQLLISAPWARQGLLSLKPPSTSYDRKFEGRGSAPS